MLGVAVSAAMLLDMVMLATGMRESFASLLVATGSRSACRRAARCRSTPRRRSAQASDATARDAADPGRHRGRPVLGATIHVLGAGDAGDGVRARRRSRGAGRLRAARGRRPADRRTRSSRATRCCAPPARAIGDTLDVAAGYDPQLRTYTGRRRLVVTGRARFLYLAPTDRAAALRLAHRAGDGRRRARRSRVALHGAHGAERRSGAGARRDRAGAAARHGALDGGRGRGGRASDSATSASSRSSSAR